MKFGNRLASSNKDCTLYRKFNMHWRRRHSYTIQSL